MKRIAVIALALLPACSDGPSQPSEPVQSVTLNMSLTGVGVGDTITLEAIVRATDGQTLDSDVVDWQSLNPGIATVNSSGLVRGVSAGSARIMAEAGGKSDTATVIVASGTVRGFNTNAMQACTQPKRTAGRLVAQTPRVAIYEDVTNPAGGPTTAQYQNVASTVEAAVYDVNVANFGAPTDVDGNGRVIVLYTRSVNELTPGNAGFVVGGFAYARDLFPRTQAPDLGACPSSNVAEMFYMLSADPSGTVNGNVRSVNYVLGTTVGIVAHEFQHVINAGRRLRIIKTPEWEETIWLNEGLSHIAEELTFYSAAGRGPRQNLSFADVLTAGPVNVAFAEYGVANIDRLDTYLEAVNTYGPFMDNDDLEPRGAIWSLLRYAADRRNGTDSQFWFNLVNSSPRGLPNLQAALGDDPMVWARDWAVANYTDDAVTGITSIYTHPSWNYRSVMTHARWGGYGLQVRQLTDGQTSDANIRGGSAAYFRFGVAPGGTGELKISRGGTTVTGTCTTVTLAPGAVFHATSAAAPVICLGGGAGGAEYALIPFNGTRDTGQESANGNVSVSVVGTGIRAPIAPPSPSPDFSGAAAPMPRRAGDGGFEGRLRRRERAELRGLVPWSAPEQVVSADPAAPGVWINVVRIR